MALLEEGTSLAGSAHMRSTSAARVHTERARPVSVKPARCRREFLRFFRGGFRDETYAAWERDYKVAAHRAWNEVLERDAFRHLLREGRFATVANHAARVESRTNLLFSFEKMALRDAVRSPRGAKLFATGLYDFLYGRGPMPQRFARWRDAVAALPRRQTRVLTWPVLTVFPFIAEPRQHLFLKPKTTRVAADVYGFTLRYRSRPQWDTYASLLEFGARLRRDLRDLRPRDMIDIQSFIWVIGSDEYASM
jgi:hypothetical protein